MQGPSQKNAEIEICCSKYARSSQEMVEVKKGVGQVST